MKKLFLLTLMVFVGFAFGQNRSVAKKVKDLNAKNQSFENFNLFTKNADVQRSSKYLTSASDVTVLNISDSELSRISAEAPKYLSLSIPYQNQLVNVQLYKQEISTDSFFAKDEKGNTIDYTPGVYYRGIVNGDYTSIAAISFFNDNVIGIVSTTELGNLVLGKSVDGTDYVSYAEHNLLGQNPFECGVDEVDYNNQTELPVYEPNMAAAPSTTNCVKIYYELAYNVYQQNGYDMDNTLDWISGVHNNISTLYDNDDIDVSLHNVMVWTSTDPYTGSYGDNLDLFRQHTTDFEGDIGHLVKLPTTTSVAYLNSLCTNYNYAYSGVSLSYQQVPVYSWTVMAMTHEMGHSMGSPHTHSCSWNGNDTAIDSCYTVEGGCASPGYPTNGGTIMSYCHLVPGVGINFNNGFGPQPGALIRSTVDSKDCLSTDCSCMFTIQDVTVSYLDNGDVQAQITDDTSSQWKYQAVLFGDDPTENWLTTNTTSFVLNDLAENTYYELIVMNVCDSGSEGGQKTAIILTGDFCDGTPFTDTGGLNGSYSPNQHIVKTFYPLNSSEKVALEFIAIGINANGGDYMYVYNGDSTSSPLFDEGTINGNNNPGPSFLSTDASGAITIEFISDGSLNSYGWEAYINCAALGVEDVSDSYGITVYPNPATDILNIVSQKGKIQNIMLTDITGRTITSKKVNQQSESLNIGYLPKGAYIITIDVDGKKVIKKIIKK